MPELLEQHYEMHKGKDFFNGLIAFMLTGQIHALIVEGEEVIRKTRELMGGVSNPSKGTIRGDFGSQPPATLIHGSDSVEAAEREIKL